MRVWLLMLVLFLGLSSPAEAHLRKPAQVRYATKEGPSDWYRVEVNFLTGRELGKATGKPFTYSMFKNYAVIFWGPNQATVIELSTFMFCSGDFHQGCLPLFGRLEGNDQDGDQWEMCTGIVCT